jgi:hypothetical protein
MSIDKPSGERGKWRFNLQTGTFEPVEKPKAIAVHSVHGDECGPIHSMTGTDKVYTSKSAYRRELKEMGFREVGEILKPTPEKKSKEQRIREIRDDVEKAYNDIKYARIPIPEKERQQTIEEERQWESYLRRQKTGY